MDLMLVGGNVLTLDRSNRSVETIVTRWTRRAGGPVTPEEALSPEEPLRTHSIGGATAMRRESEVSSLEQAKRADMVVLSHDPTAVDPHFLRDVTVEQTFVAGALVYRR